MYSIYKKIFINSLIINQVKALVKQNLTPLFLIGTLLFIALNASAQVKIGGYPSLSADNPDIHGVVFSKAGNQLSYPEMTLGSTQALTLSFDDFDARLKNYSYTYIRCDQNWQPVLQSAFDYIQGFTDVRIRDAKFSSISLTRYVHYTATLPTSQSLIKKSGNYLLKVYLDGDTSKLAFERRMLVVDPKVSVAASVVQPNGRSPIGDRQKINLSISVNRLHVQNPRDQIKVVVLQNYRWDNAVHELQPAFMRGTTYEYNSERDLLFAAGKEFRWADLKSFRFQSDRVAGVSVSDGKPAGYDVILKTDPTRNESQYMPYVDYDGFFQIASTENIQVAYQGDYGLVRFSYKTATGQPYSGRDLYVLGQFNQYKKDENSRLVYNQAKGIYEKTLLLKQGYYSYLYATAESTDQPSQTDLTEGNYWETENKYTVLVYYQSYTDRAPELVACTTVSSR